MRVEIAVRAFPDAPGEVHIQSQRRVFGKVPHDEQLPPIQLGFEARQGFGSMADFLFSLFSHGGCRQLSRRTVKHRVIAKTSFISNLFGYCAVPVAGGDYRFRVAGMAQIH